MASGLLVKKFNLLPLCRTVLEAGLTQDILKLFVSDSEDGFGMMIEFAWCLHYIVSRYMHFNVIFSQLPTVG